MIITVITELLFPLTMCINIFTLKFKRRLELYSHLQGAFPCLPLETQDVDRSSFFILFVILPLNSCFSPITLKHEYTTRKKNPPEIEFKGYQLFAYRRISWNEIAYKISLRWCWCQNQYHYRTVRHLFWGTFPKTLRLSWKSLSASNETKYVSDMALYMTELDPFICLP